MNLKKLINRTEEYLRTEERKRKEKRKYLKQVTRKLREHEKALKAQLEECDDSDLKKRLKKEIVLAHAQRKKGVKLIRSLKKKKNKDTVKADKKADK